MSPAPYRKSYPKQEGHSAVGLKDGLLMAAHLAYFIKIEILSGNGEGLSAAELQSLSARFAAIIPLDVDVSFKSVELVAIVEQVCPRLGVRENEGLRTLLTEEIRRYVSTLQPGHS